MAQTNVRAYPYRPLGEREIRFISLKPFNESIGKVECSLHQESLNSVKFDALSYVWGDPTITEPILLDGQPFHITTNLARCLRTLAEGGLPRGSEGSYNLWADAICINQHDVDERNLQVLRMREIYSAATVVVAWLGQAADSTQLAFDWLSGASNMYATGRTAEDFQSVSMQRQVEELGHSLMDPQNSSLLNGINDLFDRSWWRRVWVVQEAVSAKKLFLVCGAHALPYGDFSRAFRTFYLSFAVNVETNLEDAQTRIAPWPAMIFHVKSAADDRNLLLAELLRFTRRAQAMDPRDKIYALLGISADMSSGEIQPDYRLSVREVYMMAVEAHITKHKSLEILDGCEPRDPADSSWASWVPQWTDVDERATEFSWTPGFVVSKAIYHASDGIELERETWSIDDSRGCLHISGACVDTIARVSDVARFFSRRSNENIRADVRVSLWMGLLRGLDERYSFTGESLGEAFRRTLVADRRMGVVQGDEGFSRGFAITLPADHHAGDNSDEDRRFRDGVNAFIVVADMRRFAITSRGMIGLVPRTTQPGDEVALLSGGQVPYILKRADEHGATDEHNSHDDKHLRFHLIGEAYMHGIMDGEALSAVDIGKLTLV